MKSAIAISLLVCVAAVAQNPAMKRYASDSAGIELAYPASYHTADLPCTVARWAAGRGVQSLLYVSAGAAQQKGKIHVALDRHKFSVATLQSAYAHTGWEQPDEIQIGNNTFYYYGAGGGGVTYPDDYFYDLDGYILIISFDGPYPPTEKTPSKQTKTMEKSVLERLAVRDTHD